MNIYSRWFRGNEPVKPVVELRAVVVIRLFMFIPGQRIKRTRLIQTDKYVVAVDVEMVIPVDEPSESCYESETVKLLQEIKKRAEQGDVTWLTKRGKVYAARA